MSKLVERAKKARRAIYIAVPATVGKEVEGVITDLLERIETLEDEVKYLYKESEKEYNFSEDAFVRAETAEDRVKELEEKVRLQLDEILSLDADKKELESREVGYIQSLRDLEARVRELDWISVEDRLPPPETTVLVIDESFIKSDIHDQKGGYMKARPPGLRLGHLLRDSKTLRAEGVNGTSKIANWMPLPSPPKAE